MIAKLLLNNGMIFEGVSVGAKGTVISEICFNTSMSGYQEILTDSSYNEKIVVMTYPEIGNCGIRKLTPEKTFPKGLIMKNYCYEDNHYQSVETLSDFMKENNIVGISNIDTRLLTALIRDNEINTCLITTEEITQEMKDNLEGYKLCQKM